MYGEDSDTLKYTFLTKFQVITLHWIKINRTPQSPVAIVTMFLISMSLVIFCLLFSFVDYVPVKGEIIWYLALFKCREAKNCITLQKRNKYKLEAVQEKCPV